MCLTIPDTSVVSEPFATTSGIGYIIQVVVYAILSGGELILWIFNMRNFILWGKYVAIAGTIIAYIAPWVLHLI